MRLAVIAHLAAQLFVAACDGAGANFAPRAADHLQVRVGADHGQTPANRLVQEGGVGLGRVLERKGAGGEDEVGLGQVVDEIVVQARAHAPVALGSQMVATPAERPVPGIGARGQVLPGRFSRGHDGVAEVERDSQLGVARGHGLGAARRVRQDEHALAALVQPLQAVDRRGEGPHAVVQDAP